MQGPTIATDASAGAPTMYWLGGAVVLIFLSINVWAGTKHFESEIGIRRQNASALEAVKDLARQRVTLLKARQDSGAIALKSMRGVGVHVPEAFVRNDEFSSPWGSSEIRKEGDYLIWDFYEITPDGCTELLANGSELPGVIRVASSARAADEKTVPVSWDYAAQQCKRSPLMVRLILK